MKKTFKQVFWLFQDYYYDNLATRKISKRTGINGADKKKLQKHEYPSHGTVKIFVKDFNFNNGGALLHSIEEIFLQEVYKFHSDDDEPTIIDCGANVGLSMLYFKKLFPKSKIIAFEPDPELFNILEENVKILDPNNITAHQKAVWHEDTTLSFFVQGGLSGSIVTDFGRTGLTVNTEAVDLNRFLQNKVDFLKIDIEGAENELLFNIGSSLKNVKSMFLEYHSLKNDEQKLGEILNVIKNAGFRYYIKPAADLLRHPFMNEVPRNSFDLQLNIFCYR
ncbi:FkbM family methyltransferase [Chryseobacterium taklimakanense]|uniref:FkbM family methyltransferase n=1 Tax=Chryseobacterium taklimakanense TaxID=536441 RepID=UPI000F5FDD6F|nr:FkbM family methyltransferase [Chryseobacterium taklimakanense]AZI21927.1 FkbM family methyltransferase [Chryseobacterium taklimakanense]